MSYKIIQGDCIEGMKTLPDQCVHTVITSPPYYGLRDYGVEGQIGLEESSQVYVQRLVDVFREVRRILRNDGTVWLNLGDSYGAKKQLLGIPWRVAFALQADGWYLRQDIIWHKPNPMPESVTDRCTKSHEYIFLLSKSQRYYYDHEAIKEPSTYEWNSAKSFSPGGLRANKGQGAGGRQWNGTKTHKDEYKVGRNKRSVWSVTTRGYKEAHFAVYPPKLIEPCVLAGTSEKGCCATCGVPFHRVAKKIGEFQRRWSTNNAEGSPYQSQGSKQNIYITVKWQSPCTCDSTIAVPCTVFDPFTGSGTTAIVALQHKRNFLGTELNQEYVDIAEKRIRHWLAEDFMS